MAEGYGGIKRGGLRLQTNDSYTFTVIPTFTRYYKDNFGIYEFYTEQEGLPHLKEQVKENDFWEFSDSNGNERKTVYTGVMLGVSQILEHNLPYKLTAKLEFNNKFQTHQYKIMTISPIKPRTDVEYKRFLYTILTERQTNTLIEAYPKIGATRS